MARMTELKLSIATTDYDHFRDFRARRSCSARGHRDHLVDARPSRGFARFTSTANGTRPNCRSPSSGPGHAQEFRHHRAAGVCSRLFRFSSFYVNRKSKIAAPRTSRARRVGSPEWAHTAAVYMRGWLRRRGTAWGSRTSTGYQAGTNEAGRIEKVELSLPKGVKLTRIADKSLSDMLAAGEIDCAIIARPPDCFRRPPGRGPAVSRFPGDGGEVLRAHQGVADHAHHRAAEARAGRQSLGRRAISTTPSSPPRTAASSA